MDEQRMVEDESLGIKQCKKILQATDGARRGYYSQTHFLSVRKSNLIGGG